MSSNAPAYAMKLWDLWNDSGQIKTRYSSTDIGLDESAWRTLESKGVITDLDDSAGSIEFHPERAHSYLKLG